jgi:hypothetical protein
MRGILAAVRPAPFAGDIFHGGQQQIEQPLFRILFGFLFDFVDLFGANHVHRDFNEIANHGLDIAPDIAHFREFGRLDFQKGRIGQPCAPSGNLRFPDARWPDHDDVFGRNPWAISCQLCRRMRCAGRIPRLFSRLLPGQHTVQLLDNFAGDI